MLLQVQTFIKEHGWAALTKELAIDVEIYSEGIAKLTYDQINSPKTHPVVIECRGLILSYPDGAVVSKPFDRFFNYGEAPEITTKCDLSNADFMSKEDGSLIMMYYCPQTRRWEISTRKMAFAEGPHVLSGTFRDWVLKAMKLTEAQFQEIAKKCMSEEITYIAEYVGPSNRIVTKYDEEKLILIGLTGNIPPFIDFPPIVINFVQVELNGLGMNIHAPVVYDIKSIDEAKDTMAKFENFEEGFVARDRNTGVRVKIKSPTYLVFHRMRGNGVLTPKNIMELVVINEVDEYVSTFPEDANLIAPYQLSTVEMYANLASTWDKVKHIENQKEFALKVMELNKVNSSLYFSAKQHKTSPEIEFNKLALNKKVDLSLKNHYYGLVGALSEYVKT